MVPMPPDRRADQERVVAIMLFIASACALIATLGAGVLARDSARTPPAVHAGSPVRPPDRVRVTLWAQGPDGPRRTWDVTCPGAPGCAGLTGARLDERRSGCRAGRAGDQREAFIEGVVAGRRRAELLTRRSGCERMRWDALGILLQPPARRA